MTEKIDLFINDTSGKVHVMSRGSVSYAVCGAHAQGRDSIHRLTPIVKPTYAFAPADWCSFCMQNVVMASITGDKRALVVLNHALNRPAKKKEKKGETIVDSVRTELTFNDEEAVIKVISGESIAGKGTFTRKTDMKLILSWDQLDSIRDLTEEVEEVKMTVFSCKAADEI